MASIASVAKVKIVSRPAEQEFGSSIFAEGGAIGKAEDAPSEKGTKITVDSLFYNTPVRAKFLKTTRAEEGDITNIVSRLILANPAISFTYYADDKLILQSYGGGDEEALISVYGIGAVRNCFRIETEKNGVKIKGYVGKHNFTKPNRTYQTLIINGRYVVNSTVSSAVQNAYQAYLMKRQYPFYVLEMKIPAEAVDVNVHPNKTDVRFSNNQVIYGAVYSVISKVLDGTNEALEIIKDDSPFDGFAETKTENSTEEKFEKSYIDVVFGGSKSAANTVRTQSVGAGSSGRFIFNFAEVHNSGEREKSEKELEAEKRLEDVFAANKRYIEEMEKKAEREAEEEKPDLPFPEVAPGNGAEQTGMGLGGDLLYIGQALKTFLIFQKDEDLYFIDQHAAHERIIYDVLYENALKKSAATQPLLVPFVIDLNAVEDGYFRTRRSYIEELGFTIEDFGRNSYKITEVPLEISDINIGAFIGDVLADNSLKQEKIPDIIREKLCQRACKAAIKAGYDLSEGEIRELILKMKGDMGMKCPHGRPVAVKITRAEIEKWFKRIV
ncbi:MAG: hypothetical protein J6U35_01220 [Clostridia bacterium]|nr:hypothetical protein [Clostridia bacterium]